ncbi:TetR/AcrR family transcriptional regulator [Aureispira sp. CCB-QB1]|uniref:TetR/AcrR family transcriptional regulator n=1 Tax=Aureispira sp. CCB-QB1 TaxID=1313421 RepID=UPI0012DC1418|nr:TetR/AcrR family transcriptional regulator [Aureispira sp. CCB-QB1]
MWLLSTCKLGAFSMREIEKNWLEAGYQYFANEGPKGLKIEQLSRKVGKNKSSFYHLFVDLEVFIDSLLKFHLKQAKIISEKESKAESEEELIAIILEHKIDLLFNRQLRIHREQLRFEECLRRISQFSTQGLLPIWKNIISLSENTSLALMMLHFGLDNFYLQISMETLNESWLKAYFSDIRKMVVLFKRTF